MGKLGPFPRLQLLLETLHALAAATVGAIAGCGGKRNDPNVQKPYGAPPADGLLPEIV